MLIDMRVWVRLSLSCKVELGSLVWDDLSENGKSEESEYGWNRENFWEKMDCDFDRIESWY